MFGIIRQFLRLFLQDAVTRRTRLLDRRLPFIVNSMGGERVIRQPIRVRMLLLGDVVADDRSTYSITVGQRAGQLMNVLLRTKNSTEFFTATADRIEATAAQHEVRELAPSNLVLTFRNLRYRVVRVAVAL